MITEEFKELVSSDVRGKCTPAQIAILASNIDDWLIVLNKFKRDVEVQFAAHRAQSTAKQIECLERGSKLDWLRFREQEERWRVGTLRFMTSVEERIMFVKSLRRTETHVTERPLLAVA